MRSITAETIVAKYFISPDGEVIKVPLNHAEFAWDYLRGKVKAKSPAAAEDILKDRGWLRVQVYSLDGLGIEGLKESLNRNGQWALEIVPEPKMVYVATWPAGETRAYTNEELNSLGWDKIARRKGKWLRKSKKN